MNGQVLVTPDAMATADTDLCAVAVYTCNDGYNLVGDVIRTCQASGQWDGAEPTCMCKLYSNTSTTMYRKLPLTLADLSWSAYI